MKLYVSPHLHHLTGNRSTLDVEGETLDAALKDLDRQFPGIRFRIIDEQDRIRPHLNIFVDGETVKSVRTKVQPDGEIHILAALSGG
ncbi:MoaD/ThiS family protein [bacterium]|nr:MoaD/ThiS family protein [bacterium]